MGACLSVCRKSEGVGGKDTSDTQKLEVNGQVGTAAAHANTIQNPQNQGPTHANKDGTANKAFQDDEKVMGSFI